MDCTKCSNKWHVIPEYSEAMAFKLLTAVPCPFQIRYVGLRSEESRWCWQPLKNSSAYPLKQCNTIAVCLMEHCSFGKFHSP
ncbi:hypothetical protein TNCV_1245331 [Trichonephila clavipes]|nr:hypothetical protein TNCV_1245331 [Trichonephila clavipes]